MQIYKKATEYIKNGLSIHLLVPEQKRPINNGWSKAPFLSESDLYDEFKETPYANIGIRLGDATQLGRHYLYVLDLDISSNEIDKIQEAYSTLKTIYKDFDKLPCVKSASKNSRHFYFLSKSLLKNKKLAHSTGKVTVKVNGEDKVKNDWEIDLCSSGKQVVLPPSVFNGNTYLWERDLLEYINDDNKKALMIIDDMSLLNLDLENEDIKIDSTTANKVYKIEDIKKNLDKLPEDFFNNYDDWLKVGMALHSQFSDTDDEQEAIQLYDEFSKKSEKYEKGQAYKKWKSFSKKEDGITLGTIFYHIPKENLEDNTVIFAKFLNTETVTLKSLKEQFAICDLKDYELEPFFELIASALTEGTKMKYTVINTRKTVTALRKEVRQDREDQLDKLAVGLDDTLATMILEDKFNSGKNIINLNGNVFVYKTGRWIMQEKPVLERDVLESIKKIINSNDDKYSLIKEVIYKKKRNDNIDSLTNQIVSLILKMVATPESDDILNLQNKKEVNYSVINTLNKEIYIQNGKVTVEDHKYDSYLISQFNVAYNPEDTCPNWIAMLNRVFQKYPDQKEVVRHFCEVLGYIIQSRKKKAVFMLNLGGGNNGKSYIIEQFSKLMGIESSLNKNIKDFSEDPHAEAGLVGKNMIFDDDWKKGDLLPDDWLKKLSENKILTANPKFKNQFNFVSRCTPIINANNSAKTKDTSDGMERRVHVFNFNYKLTTADIDPFLDEKLKAERSGFLNLLIESYIAMEKRGGFNIPLSCVKAKRDWLKSSNPMLAFLQEKVVVTKDSDDRVKGQKLFDMYTNYTENENMSHTMTRNNFYDDLAFIEGISVIRDSSDKNFYIHGVKI